MAEWVYAQREPAEELALLHTFAVKRVLAGDEVEFRITVREYAERNTLQMRFFAQSDRHVNLDVAPFAPFGWGPTLLDALSECLTGIRQYTGSPVGKAGK
jgi:hypothetical protein